MSRILKNITSLVDIQYNMYKMTNMYNSANVLVNENSNNKELLKNLLLTTLLQSIKTGQTFIDSILSLVLVSEFNRSAYKYIIIVILLISGNAIKNTDIINNILNYLKMHLNGINYINLIPSEYLKKKVSTSNGIIFKIKTISIGDNHYLQEQYSILSILHKLVELNFDTPREKNYSVTEFLCYDNNTPSESVYKKFNINGSLNYEEYENDLKNQNFLTIIDGIIRNPPTKNVWHRLDNNTYINYHYSTYKELSSTFEHTLEIKSYDRNYDDILKYVDDCRVKMLINIKKCEIERKNILDDKNNNIESKNFKGELYELEIVNTDCKYTYSEKKICKICRPINTVFFNGKERLTNMLYNFKNNTGLYKKLPNKHKLGILIHGPPGGGKTSLSLAIATELRRNIIRISIKDKKLNDETLSYVLSTYRKGYVIILDELDSYEAFRPRTGVIKPPQEWENIDCVDDRKKINNLFKKNENTLTLGSFLEALDGLSVSEDRIIIGITNHPKLLDPAIIRPGRFDIIINMETMNTSCMKSYIKYVLEDIDEDDLNKSCEYATNNKISTSIIEQACLDNYSYGETTLLECITNIQNSYIF